MASSKQIDFLTAGVFNSSGNPNAGGTATFYQAGSTTLATVWKDFNNDNEQENPVTLRERGQAVVFANQSIDIDLRDIKGNPIEDFEGFTYEISDTSTFGIDASKFGSGDDTDAIQLAIASAAGADSQIFLTPQEWDINANLTIPSNINILFLYGAFMTIQTGIDLTINGSWTPILFQIFRGAGNLIVDPRNNNIPSINELNGVHDNRALTGITSLSKDDPGVSTEILRINRTSDTPADNDSSQVNFVSENDNNEQITFARQEVLSLDVSDGTEKGQLKWSVADGVDGSVDEVAKLDIDSFGLSTHVSYKTEIGITASTTQTQGQQPLTSTTNIIETVANEADTVTLPPPSIGIEIRIMNNGANYLQIFPPTGTDLGNGLNNSGILAAGDSIIFIAVSSSAYQTDKQYQTVVKDIGDWDMVADTTKLVGIPIPLTNIIDITCTIRQDSPGPDRNIVPGGWPLATDIDVYVALVTSLSGVNLQRRPGGNYDDLNWSDTSYNRGWLVFKYYV